MGWKKWPAWLKVGLGIGIITTLLLLFIFFNAWIHLCKYCSINNNFVLVSPSEVFNIQGSNCNSHPSYLIYFLPIILTLIGISLIFGLIIGAILGFISWVAKKVKSKGKKK
jgi:hypothetical protein